MTNENVPRSIALNNAYIGVTTTDLLATPLHRLPVVVPGRYSNASTKQIVEVIMVDGAGVHYREMVQSEEDESVFEPGIERKTMNAAVFALSHSPL